MAVKLEYKCQLRRGRLLGGTSFKLKIAGLGQGQVKDHELVLYILYWLV